LHAHAADPTLDITVATKGLLGKCGCTRMVQGGYNVSVHRGDSVERHFMDTIEGGKWLVDQDLAWTLVTRAVERITELENEIGCFFDRNPDGSLHGKAFCGPDLRPHRPQGRPHRHRDHQPADGAGLGAARHPPAGGASRRGADPGPRRRFDRGACC
jgi:succinate dehydrogenase/fumarate reductase flavoprotein subunit